MPELSIQPQGDNDYLKLLKDIEDKYGDQHPLFKKYLQKARTFVQPMNVPKGKEALDPNGLTKYKLLVDSVKKLGKVANDTNSLLKNIYENQLQIKGLYQKIVIVENELVQYIQAGNGTILLNDRSKDLLDKLEQFHDEMKELIQKNQAYVEDGFDTVNSVTF